MDAYNLYVDESCHLEKDGFPIMCLGYIKILRSEYIEHREAIKKIKFGHNNHAEVKWTHLSASRLPLYKELIDYFFSHNLAFHSILVQDKKDWIKAEMAKDITKDNLYYDLIYTILRSHIYPFAHQVYIYLDVKDTRGRFKVKRLSEKLEASMIKNMDFIFFQHLHSHENVLLQLVDLFIGAISYKARGEHLKPNASQFKKELIHYLELKLGIALEKATDPAKDKFNIAIYQPKQI
jgi:hypothetical protein